ncbi:MAG: hypothetical protein AAFR62_14110 [Cyanobacteria bacterium J06629_2]
MSNKEHERVYRESNQEDALRTANKGDIIDHSKTLEEKKEQVAVDSWDIAGKVKVPAYFPVEDENGEEKALHHIKDAEEISDVIRQARVDENGDREW